MILVARMLSGLVLALTMWGTAAAQSLVVGSKDFTEQRLVAELTTQLLRGKGLEIELRTGLSSPGLRTEQEAGLVDVYWEYTGTSLAV
ncbi:glycine betaine ABC transporter substrate-binding protein, partial [Nostoc sp. NIES-2111]